MLTLGTTYPFFLNETNSGGTYTTTRFSLVFEPAAGPLPVALVAFDAQRRGADGLLQWATASEQHNAYFQVESNPDGRAFTALGRVVGVGTGTQAHQYQFVDARLARYAPPQVYYLLRQVDTDGTSTFSPVRPLAVPAAPLFEVTPGAAGPCLPPAAVTLVVATSQAGLATGLLLDGLRRVLGQQ